jgi:hypothetical protein
MYRKSQAALEFLTTYSWAILSIFVVVGALYSFGVFDFSRFLPEKCIFTSQLECLAFASDSSTDVINIKLVNNLGEEINVETTTITDNSDPQLSCTGATNSAWLAGEEWDLQFTSCGGGAFVSSERLEAQITLTYFAESTPSPQPRHTVRGKIQGRVN